MDRPTYLTLKKLYGRDNLYHSDSNSEQTAYELLKSTRILTPDKELWALNQVAGCSCCSAFKDKHYEDLLIKICATRIAHAKSYIPFFTSNKEKQWLRIKIFTIMFEIDWRCFLYDVARKELLRINKGEKNILYNFYVKDFLRSIPDDEFRITWLLATAFDAFWCQSIFNAADTEIAGLTLSYLMFENLGRDSEILKLNKADRLIIDGAIFYNTLIALCTKLAQIKNDSMSKRY